ncbi:MAG: M3 family oligoendopeptidase [Desulfobia sp.]
MNKQLETDSIIWNLADLYQGTNDPVIDNEIKSLAKEAEDIRSSYEGRVNELGPEELNNLVSRLENLAAGLTRISTFAFLNFSTQTGNPEAGAFLQKIEEAASQISTKTVFFELEWNKIKQKNAEQLFQAEELQHYRHYLEKLRAYADHMLSRAEETLLLEIAPVGASSWTKLFEKILGHIKFGEKGRSEEEVLADLHSADHEVRKQAAAEMTEGLKGQFHVLTHIFNTILADKMISDRLRSYPSWIRAMNIHNEVRESTVETLTAAVTGRYDLVQRYYHLKKKLTGIKELKDYDRYAPLPNLPDNLISWPECKDMIITSFRRFSPKMAEIASLFFDRNWIHAPVQEGKKGGAFAHPCVPDVHPYVMVNYSGSLRDVSTVAHELGHGVHQYLAASRGHFNSDTPLVLAETASVFAELIVFHDQLARISGKEKKRAFICQKLESIFATVFRQISMNRFEDLIHHRRREAGELSEEAFGELWLESQKEMFGDSLTLTSDYRVWWSYIPHFLQAPGYVYSYAFGELLVLSLYKIYQEEGTPFIEKYIHLLKQGGSRSPYELVTPFGIDLDEPAFWQGGLAVIDDLLKKIEKE